jgi:hypothetical protein
MKIKTAVKAGDNCQIAWDNVMSTLNKFGTACADANVNCLR